MKRTSRWLQKRKFLLMLPVLVIPFLTLGFWALGGGKNTAEPGKTTSTGINPELPGASFKEDNLLDKLTYYERAASDSLKFQELIKSDPYLEQAEKTDTLYQSFSNPGFDHQSNRYQIPGGLNYQINSPQGFRDQNEDKVYQKLAQLNGALEDVTSSKNAAGDISMQKNHRSAYEDNINRLENVIIPTDISKSSGDPEVTQLNNMLDKILDIQHPDRMREKLQTESIEKKDQAFPIGTEASRVTFSLLDTGSNDGTQEMENKFYGTEEDQFESDRQNSIEAVVHETQTVVTGGVLKMRLLNHVYVNGQLIPKDNFVFGTVSLNNERLEVDITSMRNDQSLFPINLSVYDLDGLPGIFIPGAISRDVAKQSTDNALQSMALNSLNPTIGAQAASAGIEAAKSLVSKKVKLIRVQVKAGYRIFLKNTN